MESNTTLPMLAEPEPSLCRRTNKIAQMIPASGVPPNVTDTIKFIALSKFGKEDTSTKSKIAGATRIKTIHNKEIRFIEVSSTGATPAFIPILSPQYGHKGVERFSGSSLWQRGQFMCVNEC